jgi:hypothetical protein
VRTTADIIESGTRNRVVVVQDASKDPRYLAGSSLVKFEIVVPIFVGKGSLLHSTSKATLLTYDTFSKPEQELRMPTAH